MAGELSGELQEALRRQAVVHDEQVGSLTAGDCFCIDEEVADDDPPEHAQACPDFPGGMQAFAAAGRAGIQCDHDITSVMK